MKSIGLKTFSQMHLAGGGKLPANKIYCSQKISRVKNPSPNLTEETAMAPVHKTIKKKSHVQISHLAWSKNSKL